MAHDLRGVTLVLGGDLNSVVDEVQGDVGQVVGTEGAFVAVEHKRIRHLQGPSVLGGNSDDVQEDLASGVLQVVGAHQAFGTITPAGAVVTWGRCNFRQNFATK